MCRDWDALLKWTQEPERHACFKMIDEYREVPHSLEQFAFCPEGSRYKDTMDAYFEKWGHKNPFGDDEMETSTVKDEYVTDDKGY